MELSETMRKALLEISKNKQCICISLLKIQICFSEHSPPEIWLPTSSGSVTAPTTSREVSPATTSPHRKKRKKHSSPCPIQVDHCCFSLCSVFLTDVCQVLMWFTAGSGYGQRRSENTATEQGQGCAWERHRLRFRSPLGR